MLLNPSHMDLKTLSLIVRTLLLVTLQLIIYESAKSRVLHTFGKKIAYNTKFIHFFTDMKVKNKFEMTKESSNLGYESTFEKVLLIMKKSLLYSNSGSSV